MTTISLQDLRDAHTRIRKHIHNTPVFSSKAINNISGCSISFKCENFQRVGAFKARGGLNAVLSLSEEEKIHGVVTHSSGNHAQAIAMASGIAGCKSYIVMPSNAPQVKRAAVEEYGGKIIECEPTLEARESTVLDVINDTGATFIHPYNDQRIICGQSTAAIEFLEYLSGKPDYLLAPVGGGGLLSGTAMATHFISPDTKVIGCEPEGANDAWRSFRQNKLIPQKNPDTIADGLRTSLGELTFELITQYVHDIHLTSDERIIEAMKLIWERMKILIEPSSAVPLAIILDHPKIFKDKSVGVILSGGNVDLKDLPF